MRVAPLALAILAAPAARAQALPAIAPPTAPSAELSARVDRVAEVFRDRRALPLRERWSGFLREGHPEVFSLTVARPQCVGFVAVGREGFDDLDLAVANASGTALASDDRRDPHPYVRVCLTAPSTLHVRVAAGRGIGEAAVLTVANAPLVPPPLDEVLGTRPTSLPGGPRVARAEVGRDPAALPAAEHLARLRPRLAELGYRPIGSTRNGQLPHGQTAQSAIELRAGRCYAIQGAGGDHVDDLDLRVLSPDGRPLGQDLGTDARPIVRVCPTLAGRHAVDLRMFSGSGEWAFEVWEMPETITHRVGDDVTGVARARALEVALEAARRRLAPLGDAIRGGAWLAGVVPFAVRLRAGRCYLFGAALNESPGLLDLWLAGRDGAVLAADTNERERAMVFHCPRHDGAATVQVRVQGGRGEFVFEGFEGTSEAAR